MVGVYDDESGVSSILSPKVALDRLHRIGSRCRLFSRPGRPITLNGVSSMWCLSRFARLAAIAAVVVLAPALAQAQNKDGSAEIGIAETFTHFDTQTSLAYRVSPSIMIGYNFTKRHGGELVYESATATPR